MPRVRVEDFEDFEDDMEIDIKDDDALDRAGRKIIPKQVPKQDKDWEERRKEMIHRKFGRERD